MKTIRIQLTDEQMKKLYPLEKRIMSTGDVYAIFAQIHYPDGKMAVILLTGEQAREIHKALEGRIGN